MPQLPTPVIRSKRRRAKAPLSGQRTCLLDRFDSRRGLSNASVIHLRCTKSPSCLRLNIGDSCRQRQLTTERLGIRRAFSLSESSISAHSQFSHPHRSLCLNASSTLHSFCRRVPSTTVHHHSARFPPVPVHYFFVRAQATRYSECPYQPFESPPLRHLSASRATSGGTEATGRYLTLLFCTSSPTSARYRVELALELPAGSKLCSNSPHRAGTDACVAQSTAYSQALLASWW